MAVIELKRRLQTTQRVEIAKKSRPQIFIAHNSLSKKFLENIKKEIFFAILTKKAFKKQVIRDWIHFEFGLAGGKHKKNAQNVVRQFHIYVWKDIATDIPNLNPLKNIEAFRSVKINSKKSKNEMLKEMRDIANRIAVTNL